MKKNVKIPLSLISLVGIAFWIFLLTLLNYFDIFGNKVTNALIFILLFGLIFYNSLKKASHCKKKGWLEGTKFASILLLMWIGLKLIFNPTFALSDLFYIIGIYLTSILGGIIGVNIKKSSNF